MQKRVAPSSRALRGGAVNFVDVEQVLVLDAGLVVGALRAIGAIFGAAAGLDGEQLAELDFGGVVKLAMDLLRGENQIEQRPLIDIARQRRGSNRGANPCSRSFGRKRRSMQRLLAPY